MGEGQRREGDGGKTFIDGGRVWAFRRTNFQGGRKPGQPQNEDQTLSGDRFDRLCHH